MARNNPRPLATRLGPTKTCNALSAIAIPPSISYMLPIGPTYGSMSLLLSSSFPSS